MWYTQRFCGALNGNIPALIMTSSRSIVYSGTNICSKKCVPVVMAVSVCHHSVYLLQWIKAVVASWCYPKSRPHTRDFIKVSWPGGSTTVIVFTHRISGREGSWLTIFLCCFLDVLGSGDAITYCCTAVVTYAWSQGCMPLPLLANDMHSSLSCCTDRSILLESGRPAT